ncbi:hypothetical protein SAMN05192533_109197 [Mesobacillus persicus]|uniref:Uncharacterized protein n=1 Tax=Mesobacillus persicus TaxID=930146 RepID=A0A1H8E7Y4_9BACI|nr:hypothetical protein [Mesobacillus persicus]SEN15639.1 hypothetical protein SAMN05192533_109197 [Mesobacillus persicus]
MLENRWGNSNRGRGGRNDDDVLQNTGQNQPQKAEVKADNSGDVKQVVNAKRGAFVLPIQIAPKFAIALPAINAGLQLPILSSSGEVESEMESDSKH